MFLLVATILVIVLLNMFSGRVSDSRVARLLLGSDAVHIIIVPYRDRAEQLGQFLFYMSVYLKQFNQDKFRLYVMEQDEVDPCFNRGLLFNAGFLEATKQEKGGLGCVVLHDVDRLPLGEVDYTRCSYPTHLMSELEEINWGIHYNDFFGGVVIASPDDIRAFNGMSNDYRGWGREDDDLLLRVKQVTRFARPQPGHGKYYHMVTNHTARQTCEDRGHRNAELYVDAWKSGDRWKRDGLNSVKYKITETRVLVKDFAVLYKIAEATSQEDVNSDKKP